MSNLTGGGGRFTCLFFTHESALDVFLPGANAFWKALDLTSICGVMCCQKCLFSLVNSFCWEQKTHSSLIRVESFFMKQSLANCEHD